MKNNFLIFYYFYFFKTLSTKELVEITAFAFHSQNHLNWISAKLNFDFMVLIFGNVNIKEYFSGDWFISFLNFIYTSLYKTTALNFKKSSSVISEKYQDFILYQITRYIHSIVTSCIWFQETCHNGLRVFVYSKNEKVISNLSSEISLNPTVWIFSK